MGKLEMSNGFLVLSVFSSCVSVCTKDGGSSHVVILYRIYLQCTQPDEVSHLVQINKFSKHRLCMSPDSNVSCSAVFNCETTSSKMMVENILR